MGLIRYTSDVKECLVHNTKKHEEVEITCMKYEKKGHIAKSSRTRRTGTLQKLEKN